ncbi:sugar-transfer associated ATP-grasp domain-containing protein [Salinisphaera hydrothermalis]|uniref:sugar-transfer associated ATP-grasp domain-containing protein n=1 Tax=Salinisphaera hydrothermalis TaxID=563188 RepID=UPI003342990C
MRSTDHQSRLLRLAKALKPNLLVKALSGAPVLWLMLPEDDRPGMTVHRLFARQCWQEGDRSQCAVLVAGAGAMFPALLIAATVYSWRCGARVRHETGKAVSRQWLEQVALGCRVGVSPPWYYMFEFYRPEIRQRARDYLYRSETKSGIYDMLRRQRGCSESTERLRDKAAFAAHCHANGLSVVRTLAVARNGQIDGDIELPAADLFFKPIKGAGGRGASRWFSDGPDHYLASDGTRVTRAALTEHLRTLSQDEAYVVRLHLAPHSDIRDLTAGALPTVRLVTCLNQDEDPEATHAVFRMPRSPDVVVDNFHAGGIASAVDLVSGELGTATDMGLTAESRWFEQHPTTGAQVVGRTLPHWPAVVALGVAAHRLFPDQVAIGWDIAILEDGPCLVEGNKSPDLDILQRTTRSPAGDSRLGTLLAHHMKQAFSDRQVTAY